MQENNPSGDETIVVPKAQYDDMVEKLADRSQTTVNLVEEVKELRSKNQITEAEAAKLREELAKRANPAPATDLTPDAVAETATEAVRKILSERDEQTAKDNREAALEAFKSKYKEFHPDNDEGGIKFSAFERELREFDLSGLKTQKDFMTKFEKARNLVVGNSPRDIPDAGDPNPLPPDGGGRSAPINDARDDKFTPKEMQIIERSFGGDKDRYLKIKAKRPDYVATLLEYSRH